ncbi:hypothetical protein GcM1_150010, partial [Golovinomyces cichoracearum]
MICWTLIWTVALMSTRHRSSLKRLPRNDAMTYSFTLDTATTSHIIREKSYFANYKVCQKIV